MYNYKDTEMYNAITNMVCVFFIITTFAGRGHVNRNDYKLYATILIFYTHRIALAWPKSNFPSHFEDDGSVTAIA